MAKPKIIWSNRAKIKRYEILRYFITRNKNTTYSKKLNTKINSELRLLIKNPQLGLKTDIPEIRGLVIGNYILFYEAINDDIYIHYIWDSRQNPDDLIIK